MSDAGKQRLIEISKKIEDNKKLSADDQKIVADIKAKLEKAAKDSAAEQKKAAAAAAKAESESAAKKAAMEQEKAAAISDKKALYDQQTSQEIKDVAQFKNGMITPE